MELKEIVIVQGDSYNCEIELENFNFDVGIDVDIYFTCKRLNVCEKFIFSKETKTFILNLSSVETSNYQKGIYDYDITIKLENATRTIQYKSTIVILEKNNEVVCYG